MKNMRNTADRVLRAVLGMQELCNDPSIARHRESLDQMHSDVGGWRSVSERAATLGVDSAPTAHLLTNLVTEPEICVGPGLYRAKASLLQTTSNQFAAQLLQNKNFWSGPLLLVDRWLSDQNLCGRIMCPPSLRSSSNPVHLRLFGDLLAILRTISMIHLWLCILWQYRLVFVFCVLWSSPLSAWLPV
jgi:hypothetical protein